MVEQLALNETVVGSNPTGGTKRNSQKRREAFLRFVRAELYRVKRDSEPGAASTYVYESVIARIDLVTCAHIKLVELARLYCVKINSHAEVAKLVDAPALGADGVTHGSSSLPLGTNKKTTHPTILLDGLNYLSISSGTNAGCVGCAL